MTSWLIKGGRIIDPGPGINIVGDLIIKDSKVLWYGSGEPSLSYDNVLNAQGMFVCPGFIDVHCHLRDPGYEAKETIATGTKAAAKGGFTTICCMPNTNPLLDNVSGIEYVKNKTAKEGSIRVLPIGCVTKGQKGKELAPLAEMAQAGAVAFSDDGLPVSDPEIMRQALVASLDLKLPIINHCEDMALAQGGVVNEGNVSVNLGLPGIPASAEEKMVSRDLELAELTGGKLHIAHVSTKGSVELIRRAKAKGVKVTAEVTPHHLTLTEKEVLRQGSLAKVNPPLRTNADIESLIQGLKDNTIDIIATDHAPHTAADKAQDMQHAPSGISGFETALGALMSLVHEGLIALPVLITKLTSGPASIIGSAQLGTLAAGSPANITIFDPLNEWVVNPVEFVSKGKNTPLAGRVLKGKVMATFCEGNLVYKEKTLNISE